MSPNDAGSWYFESLDRIANLEFKSQPAALGTTDIRYRAARKVQGDKSICGQIATGLLPRLGGGTVLLLTGTGNPVWLPHGESDGPSGVAVLARVLAALGTRPCLVSEARFLGGIKAAVSAVGMPILPESQWLQRSNAAVAIEFPTGAKAARPFVDDLLLRMPDVRAVFFVEKPGPNARGVFHNSSGKPKDSDWVAHAHVLAQRAHELGIPTFAVGDGGNEIGFGRAREELVDVHPRGRDCGCDCHGGLLDNTYVDHLLPASVSNWGAYAIAVALCLASGQRSAMPGWDHASRSIAASVEAGAFDGYSGMAVATVDGTSLNTNRAVYDLMLETLRMAETSGAIASGR